MVCFALTKSNVFVGVEVETKILPERRTRSFIERLLLAKDCLRVVKLENGEGMLVKVSEARETMPSRRPVNTFHVDFLNYTLILNFVRK